MTRFRIAAITFALLTLSCVGCLVIDTIEFSDEINYPLEILTFTPQYSLKSVCTNETQIFSATVWDPNEPDARYSDMRAKLLFFDDSNPNAEGQAFDCVAPRAPSTLIDTSEDYEIGALIYLECELSGAFIGSESDVLITAKLRISDLGFANSTTPKRDAHTAEVTWFLRTENCN